jgi:NADH-quinone oxidoreductase subunit J
LGSNLAFFYLFATVAVVSTLFVVAQPNPIHSVLLLIASFMALAGLYVLLDAPFVAVTQIIVYAGAIMVLFLFVVMLLNVAHEETVKEVEAASAGATSGAVRWFGALLAVAMALELVWALNRSRGVETSSSAPGVARQMWSVADIGRILFTKYAFAFEATSVLILIAMIGSVTIAGRHLAEKKPWRR